MGKHVLLNQLDNVVDAITSKADNRFIKKGSKDVVATTTSQGLSDAQKLNARTNIGAGTSSFSGSYNDLTNKPTIPTKVSQLTNDSGYTTNTGTITGITMNGSSKGTSGVVNLGTVITDVSGKVDKETGKGLSTNDYTTAEKNKLAGIASGAEVNVQSDWNQTTNTADDFIKNKPNLGTAAAKNFTTSVTSGSADLVTSGAVYTAIDNLPEPMVFKGSVGTNGTITTLPTAAASNEGFTYKVISNLSTPVTAKIGDTVISNGTEWVVIPSGDEPSGTVTSVGITDGGGLSIGGSPVTSSGSITVGHSNSVTAGTAKGDDSKTLTFGGTFTVPSVTYDSNGHITAKGTTTMTMPANPNTDTSVTAVGNHYTPATDSSADKSASASGATAAWGIDVVKGVTLSRDAKGHVTDISVTSGKIPANPVPSNNVTGSGTNGYIAKWNGANTVTNGPAFGSSTTTYLRNDGNWGTPPDNDTKNTAGSTDTSSKIFLIGATSQAANPQTYSHDTAYVGTDGCLYSDGTKVLTSHQDISGKADKSATVSTVTYDITNHKLTKTINGTTSDVHIADATVTSGSNNLVTSGAVYTAINTAIGNAVDNLLATNY